MKDNGVGITIVTGALPVRAFSKDMPEVNPPLHLQGTERPVVTENGKRVGDPFATVEEAQAFAKRRQSLAEAAGQPAPQVAIRQTLNG